MKLSRRKFLAFSLIPLLWVPRFDLSKLTSINPKRLAARNAEHIVTLITKAHGTDLTPKLLAIMVAHCQRKVGGIAVTVRLKGGGFTVYQSGSLPTAIEEGRILAKRFNAEYFVLSRIAAIVVKFNLLQGTR